jgi:hypothetical protein
MARQIASSREGRTARRPRKKVEMLFAHLKRILKLDRLGLRARQTIAESGLAWEHGKGDSMPAWRVVVLGVNAGAKMHRLAGAKIHQWC